MVIEICGGVGSGKSLVLKHLASDYCAEIIEMDKLAHDLYRRGEKGYEAVLALLGPSVLGVDGNLDRGKMAERLYGDGGLMERLNRIVHPLVYAETERRVRASDRALTVVETALPSGRRELYREVWYLHAPRALREERLTRDRGYTAGRIRQIMERQPPEEAYEAWADRVIRNAGSREELLRAVDEALSELGLRPAGSPVKRGEMPGKHGETPRECGETPGKCGGKKRTGEKSGV